MKELKTIILEKLKLDKNINISNQVDVLCKYSDTDFSKEEFEQIVEGAKNLPIIPDYIYNGLKDSINSKPSKSFINLTYLPNPDNKEDRYRGFNMIRIRKDPKEKNDFVKGKENFLVRFIRMDHNNTDFYPVEENEYFHSIKECFDGIKEGWEDLHFDKSIEKYKA